MRDEFDLARFEALREAFIDASSIIYMQKAGFLRQLQELLKLYTVPEVLAEAGITKSGFSFTSCDEENVSNDRKLLRCTLERQIPLISEDKKLLMQAKRAGLPYYNALMMLNFLLFRRVIDAKEYEDYYRSLRRDARYSEEVWSYGEKLRQYILNTSIGVTFFDLTPSPSPTRREE